MAKDPAFLFYPNDWIGGTMGMTFEEKGAYVELLMYQFNRGHMTKHMIERMIGQLWVNLEVKFKVDNDGLYYNERLDIEKEKRKQFTQSRRNNVLGKNQYAQNQKKEGHMTSHMENEDENENINGSENAKWKLKGGLGENKKGVRFDENFEKVFFTDDSWQLLGSEQKILAETGGIYASTIIKGSIY